MPSSLTPHYQAWQEGEEGHWSRSLSHMESYFWFVGNATRNAFKGRESGFIFSMLKLDSQGTLDSKRLKSAWMRLRFDQPGIATTIDAATMTLNYYLPSESDIAKWLEESFFVYENTTWKELYPQLKAVENASLLWLPSSSELIIRSPHWKCDGIGALFSWKLLFEILQQSEQPIKWGEEVSRLARTSDEIWNHSETPTAEQTEKAKELFEAWQQNNPGVGPPSRAGQVSPGKCHFTIYSLDEKATSELAIACKSQKTSVTIAIHAAFILANKRHSDNTKKDRNYASWGSFDIRRHLGNPYNTSSHAFNLYYCALPMVLTVGSFEEICKELTRQYREFQDGFKDPFSREAHVRLPGMLYDAAQQPGFFEGPPATDALFSSMGVIENCLDIKHGPVEILDVMPGMDVVVGANIAVLYTFRKQLRLNYCYDATCQDEADIKEILTSTMDILQEELDWTIAKN